MIPFSRPEEDDRIMAACDEMFASFPAARLEGLALATRLKGLMDVLSGTPAWAIEKACLTIRRHGYEVVDRDRKRLEQTWPPSDPQVYAAVVRAAEQRGSALASAKALLAAPVEPPAPERPTKDIADVLADFQAKTAESRLAQESEESKRRDEYSARVRKRNLEDRRAEYLAAGLEPPAVVNGVITSLPMMLKMGWMIEGPARDRVLVGPKGD